MEMVQMTILTDEHIREEILKLVKQYPRSFSQLGFDIGGVVYDGSSDVWNNYVDQFQRIINELEDEGFIIRRGILYYLRNLCDIWRDYKISIMESKLNV